MGEFCVNYTSIQLIPRPSFVSKKVRDIYTVLWGRQVNCPKT